MRNEKKRTITWIVLSSLLVIVVFIILIVRNSVEWRYFDTVINMDSIVHVEVSLLNEDDIVFIVDTENQLHITSRYYLPNHHIFGKRHVGRVSETERQRDSVTQRQQLDIVIYDLFTGEIVKEINVLEMIEEFKESLDGYQLVNSSPLSIHMLESGDLYLQWRFSNSKTWREGNYQYIGLNSDTGEFLLHDNMVTTALTENERELAVQMSFFGERWMEDGIDDLNSFYLNNGITRYEIRDFSISQRNFYSYFPNTVTVVLSPDNLPMESENLYNRFPGLRDFQGKDGVRINLVLTAYPTAEEVFELFMEDGHEVVFDGLIMSSDHSIDGEEHEIHSFEDYLRLRDIDTVRMGLDEEQQSVDLD